MSAQESLQLFIRLEKASRTRGELDRRSFSQWVCNLVNAVERAAAAVQQHRSCRRTCLICVSAGLTCAARARAHAVAALLFITVWQGFLETSLGRVDSFIFCVYVLLVYVLAGGPQLGNVILRLLGASDGSGERDETRRALLVPDGGRCLHVGFRRIRRGSLLS